MDVDMEHNDDGSNYANKGTIRAYFYNIHSKGARPTKFQGKKTNGGGSKPTTTNLKTTMKKSQKSKKKMGTLSTKGAKSRIKGMQLTRELGTDSSQMEISRYFSKKGGKIGTGLCKNIGRIPSGVAFNPLKTGKC